MAPRWAAPTRAEKLPARESASEEDSAEPQSDEPSAPEEPFALLLVTAVAYPWNWLQKSAPVSKQQLVQDLVGMLSVPVPTSSRTYRRIENCSS